MAENVRLQKKMAENVRLQKKKTNKPGMYMRTRIYYIMLLLLLIGATAAHSQERHTEFSIDFRVNSASIDTTYSDNAVRMQELKQFIGKLRNDSTITITGVSFCGSASPEGSYQVNHRLSRARLATLENLIRKEIDIPDSIITRDEDYIDWESLRAQVAASDIKYKETVLVVIDLERRYVDYPGGQHIDHRITKLKNIAGGSTWNELYKRYFKGLRYAYVMFDIEKKAVLPPPTLPVMEEPIDTLAEIPAPVTIEPEWIPHVHIKTNTLGLALIVANAAVEIDIAKHWSFHLPFYYSALNYFVSTIKFRTMAVQPEFRFWFNKDNTGLFTGAHFTAMSYNIALHGDYRYQDHAGKVPALGGGISLGYRMPLNESGRWNLEFVLGAGVYNMHYDTFYNVKNGKHVATYKKTYWGLDNAAINLTYRFGIKKQKK